MNSNNIKPFSGQYYHSAIQNFGEKLNETREEKTKSKTILPEQPKIQTWKKVPQNQAAKSKKYPLSLSSNKQPDILPPLKEEEDRDPPAIIADLIKNFDDQVSINNPKLYVSLKKNCIQVLRLLDLLVKPNALPSCHQEILEKINQFRPESEQQRQFLDGMKTRIQNNQGIHSSPDFHKNSRSRLKKIIKYCHFMVAQENFLEKIRPVENGIAPDGLKKLAVELVKTLLPEDFVKFEKRLKAKIEERTSEEVPPSDHEKTEIEECTKCLREIEKVYNSSLIDDQINFKDYSTNSSKEKVVISTKEIFLLPLEGLQDCLSCAKFEKDCIAIALDLIEASIVPQWTNMRKNLTKKRLEEQRQKILLPACEKTIVKNLISESLSLEGKDFDLTPNSIPSLEFCILSALNPGPGKKDPKAATQNIKEILETTKKLKNDQVNDDIKTFDTLLHMDIQLIHKNLEAILDALVDEAENTIDKKQLSHKKFEEKVLHLIQNEIETESTIAELSETDRILKEKIKFFTTQLPGFRLKKFLTTAILQISETAKREIELGFNAWLNEQQAALKNQKNPHNSSQDTSQEISKGINDRMNAIADLLKKIESEAAKSPDGLDLLLILRENRLSKTDPFFQNFGKIYAEKLLKPALENWKDHFLSEREAAYSVPSPINTSRNREW